MISIKKYNAIVVVAVVFMTSLGTYLLYQASGRPVITVTISKGDQESGGASTDSADSEDDDRPYSLPEGGTISESDDTKIRSAILASVGDNLVSGVLVGKMDVSVVTEGGEPPRNYRGYAFSSSEGDVLILAVPEVGDLLGGEAGLGLNPGKLKKP